MSLPTESRCNESAKFTEVMGVHVLCTSRTPRSNAWLH